MRSVMLSVMLVPGGWVAVGGEWAPPPATACTATRRSCCKRVTLKFAAKALAGWQGRAGRLQGREPTLARCTEAQPVAARIADDLKRTTGQGSLAQQVAESVGTMPVGVGVSSEVCSISSCVLIVCASSVASQSAWPHWQIWPSAWGSGCSPNTCRPQQQRPACSSNAGSQQQQRGEHSWMISRTRCVSEGSGGTAAATAACHARLDFQSEFGAREALDFQGGFGEREAQSLLLPMLAPLPI